MSRAKVQYVISVREGDDDVMFVAPVSEGDREYFLNGILPTLKSVSDDEYMHGPAMILRTAARYSYVLFRTDVYWCSEWEPGLIVVRFSPNGELAWSALRSPIPGFGGRKPKAKNVRDYNENAENHQYNLVFNAWDAQFDLDWRKCRSFKRADRRTIKTYSAALAHAETLGQQLQARYSAPREYDRWMRQCKQNLKKWCGERARPPV